MLLENFSITIKCMIVCMLRFYKQKRFTRPDICVM